MATTFPRQDWQRVEPGEVAMDAAKLDAAREVCTRWGLRSTVIARYGDEGPEYKSGTIFATTGADPELALAYKLARKLGLLPVKP